MKSVKIVGLVTSAGGTLTLNRALIAPMVVSGTKMSKFVNADKINGRVRKIYTKYG